MDELQKDWNIGKVQHDIITDQILNSEAKASLFNFPHYNFYTDVILDNCMVVSTTLTEYNCLIVRRLVAKPQSYLSEFKFIVNAVPKTNVTRHYMSHANSSVITQFKLSSNCEYLCTTATDCNCILYRIRYITNDELDTPPLTYIKKMGKNLQPPIIMPKYKPKRPHGKLKSLLVEFVPYVHINQHQSLLCSIDLSISLSLVVTSSITRLPIMNDTGLGTQPNGTTHVLLSHLHTGILHRHIRIETADISDVQLFSNLYLPCIVVASACTISQYSINGDLIRKHSIHSYITPFALISMSLHQTSYQGYIIADIDIESTDSVAPVQSSKVLLLSSTTLQVVSSYTECSPHRKDSTHSAGTAIDGHFGHTKRTVKPVYASYPNPHQPLTLKSTPMLNNYLVQLI